MDNSSEDESSDSSNEFLVNADQIDLDSSFFTAKFAKPNLRSRSETEESELEECEDQENPVETFSEVLKNLESIRRNEANADSDVTQEKCESASLSNEINELLLRGESGITSKKSEDLEENEDEQEAGTSNYTIPKEGVKITLPGTHFLLNKKKKSKVDIETRIRNRIRAIQILVEKVSRLCWLAHGFYLNNQINDPEVMAASLSLVSKANYPKGRTDLSYLEKLVKWFRNLFVVESEEERPITREVLTKGAKEKKVNGYKELIVLFVSLLRAMGMKCRLIISLCPPRPVVPKLKKTEETEDGTKMKTKEGKRDEKKEGKGKNKRGKKEEANKLQPQNSKDAEKLAKLDARKRAAEILKSKASENSDSSSNVGSQHVNKKRGRPKETVKDNEQHKKEKKEDQQATKSLKETKEIENVKKKAEAAAENKSKEINLRSLRSKRVAQHNEEVKKETKVKKEEQCISSSSEEEEEEDKKRIKTVAKNKDKNLRRVRPNRSTKDAEGTQKDKLENKHSSDEEAEEGKGKVRKKRDFWTEVYVESEESWISVDVIEGKIHCVEDIYRRATSPVLYVISWNAEGEIKDVTRRYCAKWLTVTRKQRIEEKWWTETLSFWLEKESSIGRAENESFLQRELEQPLPKTIGECKGHPLYVLQRHLLKYEALYPPNCVPLGRLPNGEPIYSRHCVHVLCSRETWLKKARVVKPKQEPYKIVKALPKYDKLSGMKLKDTALELFGEWQTTDYVPPEAKDGKVPRNEYGNVDLFKQCMLPKGTVHINLPGLNRIAKKLNIDCAPAVVGFNFGAMGAVPAFEGFVVCQEYEMTLREAWEAEQIEAARRAKEKRENRIYGNWKKLIKGLLIREKLAAKYEFKDEEGTSKRKKQDKGGNKKVRTS